MRYSLTHYIHHIVEIGSHGVRIEHNKFDNKIGLDIRWWWWYDAIQVYKVDV